MAYESKPNTGTLFNNDRKEKDTHPDMTGTINVAGVDHWFSAWRKQGSKGEFLSVAIGNKKEAKQQTPRQPDQQDRDLIGDEAPF